MLLFVGTYFHDFRKNFMFVGSSTRGIQLSKNKSSEAFEAFKNNISKNNQLLIYIDLWDIANIVFIITYFITLLMTTLI